MTVDLSSCRCGYKLICWPSWPNKNHQNHHDHLLTYHLAGVATNRKGKEEDEQTTIDWKPSERITAGCLCLCAREGVFVCVCVRVSLLFTSPKPCCIQHILTSSFFVFCRNDWWCFKKAEPQDDFLSRRWWLVCRSALHRQQQPTVGGFRVHALFPDRTLTKSLQTHKLIHRPPYILKMKL